MKYVKRPRYSHHQHSFRMRPHQETSYALLAFVLLLALVILSAFTRSTLAGLADPVTTSITVKTTILTAPPSFGATITTPADGQVFSDSDVTVAGACAPNRKVKVMKNTLLAGTVLCNVGGRYSLTISLFGGKNALTANSYDAADQAGPVNPGVTVTYNAPSAGVPVSTTIPPVTITGGDSIPAVYTGQETTFPLTISGGVMPYAVYITWGDGTDNVYSKAQPGSITFGHTYSKPGPTQDSYSVLVTVTDSAGHRTTLPLTIIVRSRISGLSSEPVNGGKLLIAWPVLVAALAMVLSFWVGELITSGALRVPFNPLLQR